ncbi:Amidase 1 [Platanthera zijinensis]|uniref:Amidase 1 n=1 Tax=Platanthera zijinensis TaxID=2320716 RepID=A0AAP0BQN7_9ASPA
MAQPTAKCEDCGAFIKRFILCPPSPALPPSPPLPLHGLTFAVKDIFDIEGHVTGFGNPDWARTHVPATSTAPTVLALLEAGATCVGKTIMDEMAYSINGENKHYGTPINVCAPDRVPGGSSSGSAVAVAAGLVDFSLGTDTGGSVRVPASYCGIFGFRPSHAVVSTSKVIPMAQSFDTVGWFARDPMIISKVGHVLLPLPGETNVELTHFIIAKDCFKYLGSLGEQISHIVAKSVEVSFGSHLITNKNLGNYIYEKVSLPREFLSNASGSQASTIPALGAVSFAMRLLQRFEFMINHGKWLESVKPSIGPGISERIMEALASTDDNVDSCMKLKSELKDALTSLLGEYGVLAIPTVPGTPPKLNQDSTTLEDFRAKAFSLLAVAGLSGFCQISVPLGLHNGLPVSVSLIARHGADYFLLNLVQAFYQTLKEQAAVVWESGL